MSAPGTTPGPWFAGDEDEGFDGIEYVEVHAGTCGTETFRSIAHVQPGFADDFLPLDDEARANAHLIAAAPDLFDALQLVLDTYGFDSSTDSSIWQTVCAALAKASPSARSSECGK